VAVVIATTVVSIQLTLVIGRKSASGSRA